MRTPNWHLQGMSVTGYRHREDGIPCQDTWGHSAYPQDDVFVLAVADGAGSRPNALEGAELAVELVRKRFIAVSGPPLDPRSVRDYLRAEFEEVRSGFLRETGARCDDYATTLTVVVRTPEWLGYLSVGDGFAIVRSGSDNGQPQFHLLPQPAAVSEYSNEAFFVTSRDVGKRLVADCVIDPGINGILLSTDGLTQAALLSPGNDRKRPRDPFVAKVLSALERDDISEEEEMRQLAAFLGSRTLASDNADDKTLLRAVRC
jgi:hypothetical protein